MVVGFVELGIDVASAQTLKRTNTGVCKAVNSYSIFDS